MTYREHLYNILVFLTKLLEVKTKKWASGNIILKREGSGSCPSVTKINKAALDSVLYFNASKHIDGIITFFWSNSLIQLIFKTFMKQYFFS